MWVKAFAVVTSYCMGTFAVGLAQAPPNPYLRTPSPRQLLWQQREYYAFVHFGPNTFTGEEWGRSQSTPDIFNPTALDTDQWAKSFSEAGMAGMILTAKHHDGMALWDTNSTTYKIGNGKWAKKRTSEGLDADVVRLAAASAKKYGLEFGIYLSPWDIHRDPAMPKGHLNGTIYEEPQIFGDNNPGDYNDLYIQQLQELVTLTLMDGSPVELFEIWLDGASGSSTQQTFDWGAFRDIIRLHQPDATMWGHQGVDARWVGNEDGVTVTTNWHTIDRTQDDERYGERDLETGIRDGKYWTPSEADARIRSGWFFHSNESPKTADELMNMYMLSVGRSVNLLLNVAPDTTGQLPATDVNMLLKFKSIRDNFLTREVLKPHLEINATSTRGNDSTQFGPANVLRNDGNYWTMDDGETVGSLIVHLEMDYVVDAFIVQEHIALGQRIGKYSIDVMVNGSFRSVAPGTSMGYKRYHQLTEPIKTKQIRLRIQQANAVPLVQYLQVLGVPYDHK